ncbi:MAG: hypothetical protein CL506_00255 [Actinobacteria bacterium]|nr:hypothetical protein [Actinomycetota bacterium]|tara:strand:+ start:69 stop:698 length:630 start_codon:yes stop_codon:yes gene_type:complete
MRILLILLILLTIFACSETERIQVDTVYSIDDVLAAGIKVKNDLKTEFPQATDAKWGFIDSREVAVIRYPTAEIARTLGATAAQEQTQFIEIVEKNIAHGPKVEKTKCRGLKSNRYGFNNKMNFKTNPEIGLGNILILNKLKIFENEINLTFQEAAVCVRREPLYSDFVIHGNLVFLGEPLMKDYGQGQMIESAEKTIKFLEEVVERLP